jgi:nitrogen regulatory protein PII
MKLITAVIKPFKLDSVREALLEAGAPGVTITEVRGVGRQKGHTELYRGSEYAVDFLPKIKVEVLCSDDMVKSLVNAIIEEANTSSIGDGKIYIRTLDEVIRIRTGQTGPDAL